MTLASDPVDFAGSAHGRARGASAPRHRYFVCHSYADEALPWDLDDPSQDFAPHYLQRVLREMEQTLRTDRRLTFYITWKLDTLPSYGPDVIAVVLGDEWSRVPDYADRVLATFKCYGTRPPLGGALVRNPSYLNLLLTIKYVRTLFHWAPGALRYGWARLRAGLRGAAVPRVFDLPLGYGNQLDLPIRPITERGADLFFAGSVNHDTYPVWSPKFWLQSPKTVSRSRMMQAVEALLARRPDLRAHLATTSSFALNAIYYGTADPSEVLDAERYSEAMMDTRICLVPRGTSPETFRFFEALRAGCVLITEPLPERWFYVGSPAVEIDDWSRLGEVVEALLADEAMLQRKQEAALRWWREVCSEAAVGRFMAARLEATLAVGPSTQSLRPSHTSNSPEGHS